MEPLSFRQFVSPFILYELHKKITILIGTYLSYKGLLNKNLNFQYKLLKIKMNEFSYVIS